VTTAACQRRSAIWRALALVDAALQDDAQRRVLAAAQAEPQLAWAQLLPRKSGKGDGCN